jgi:DNA-binding transcriptional MerR regulator
MFVQFSEILAVEDRPHLIGELAERFGVTLRTIRFYEQRGLISPTRADPHTRVYRGDDVARLGFIVTCRRLGLAVETIADLLTVRDRRDPTAFRASLKAALARHRDALEAARVDLENQLAYVDNWLDEFATEV